MSVNSHNEWDKLKEVIVGTADRSAAVLSWAKPEPPSLELLQRARELSVGGYPERFLEEIAVDLDGICQVLCDDGKQKKMFVLDNSSKGLYIPKSIWSEQIYKADNTLLLVLCDQLYDKDDYIRDYVDFQSFRKSYEKGIVK